MVKVKIKRVYESEEQSDGLRVLVDKLWPRGIKKENLHYNLWEKDITPSTPLREWFHQDEPNHWNSFKKQYTEELKNSSAMKEFLEKIKDKQTVTLLYASKNATENHALILQDYIEKKLR